MDSISNARCARRCPSCRKEFRPKKGRSRQLMLAQVYCSQSCALAARNRARARYEDADVDGAQHRRCRTCDAWKPLVQSYKRARQSGGFASECKACEKAYRATVVDQIKETNARNYAAIKSDPQRMEKLRNQTNVRQRRYYAANPEKYRARAIARSREPMEKAWRASYKIRYRARAAQLARKYYWQDHAKSLAAARRWRAEHPEDVLARAAYDRARRKKAVIQHVSGAMLRARASVFGNACAYCNGPHEHWDHVIPISRGGKHCLANLRPACARCNLNKHDKKLGEWLTPKD